MSMRESTGLLGLSYRYDVGSDRPRRDLLLLLSSRYRLPCQYKLFSCQPSKLCSSDQIRGRLGELLVERCFAEMILGAPHRP
jgi:hypothetical protein